MSTSLDYARERERIMNTLYPSFEVPLKEVRRWVRQSSKDAKEAVVILQDLRKRYPFAIKVGDELVLALLQAGEIDKAKQELKQLEQDFHGQLNNSEVGELNEEIICRVGRIHREIGNSFAFPERSGPPDYRRALEQYNLAWDHYALAYRIRAGHFPGINCAWLDLLKAWVVREAQQRAGLLAQARATAQKLLDTQRKWPADLPDDDIWHAGTEGDARLILGQVAEARECYRKALELADQPFYKEAIGKMVKAARPALQEVGGIPENELDSIVKLFE